MGVYFKEFLPPRGLGGEKVFLSFFILFPQKSFIFPNLANKTLTSRGKNYFQRVKKRKYTPLSKLQISKLEHTMQG